MHIGESYEQPELEMDPPRLLMMMSMLEEFPAFRHKLIGWMAIRYEDELTLVMQKRVHKENSK